MGEKKKKAGGKSPAEKIAKLTARAEELRGKLAEVEAKLARHGAPAAAARLRRR